jgi:hypothetical protein
MTFKQFSAWCNERAADGQWGMDTAIRCSTVCSELYKIFFLWREKTWKAKYEAEMLEIVNDIEHKIELAKEGKLKEEIDAKRKHTLECYAQAKKSIYNMGMFRPVKGTNYFMKMPFIVKPEAGFSDKVYSNETELGVRSTKLGDYMSQDYNKVSLDESLIYNEYMRKFVYSIDIYPTNLDICDELLVLTADKIEDFDGDAIDRFIAGFIDDSFLEYDKEEIQKMIDQNNETIKAEQERNEFLSGYIK